MMMIINALEIEKKTWLIRDSIINKARKKEIKSVAQNIIFIALTNKAINTKITSRQSSKCATKKTLIKNLTNECLFYKIVIETYVS